jgi:hypothetical protein
MLEQVFPLGLSQVVGRPEFGQWSQLREVQLTKSTPHAKERPLVSCLHDYVLLTLSVCPTLFNDISISQYFIRRPNTSGIICWTMRHIRDDSYLYYLRSYFDQWEIGYVTTAFPDPVCLAGQIYRISPEDKRSLILSSLQSRSQPLSGLKALLCQDIQPFNNPGHMWWNGANGVFHHYTMLSKSGVYQSLIKGYTAPICDYFHTSLLFSELGFERYPPLINGEHSQLGTLLVPCDSMIYSGTTTALIRRNLLSLSSRTTNSFCTPQLSSNPLLCIGLKGSDRQCSYAQQVSLSFGLLRRLYPFILKHNINIHFTGCISPLPYYHPTPDHHSVIDMMPLEVRQSFLAFLNQERQLYAEITRLLSIHNLNIKTSLLSGYPSFFLSNYYNQCFYSFFTGGSTAVMAAIFGCNMSIALPTQDQQISIFSWGDTKQQSLNQHIIPYSLDKDDFLAIDNIIESVATSVLGSLSKTHN